MSTRQQRIILTNRTQENRTHTCTSADPQVLVLLRRYVAIIDTNAARFRPGTFDASTAGAKRRRDENAASSQEVTRMGDRAFCDVQMERDSGEEDTALTSSP